jgi:hypothetical protein
MCTITIYTRLRYSKKDCATNCDVWIICHNHVKGFTKIELTLSTRRATTFDMAYVALDFNVS